MAWLRDSNILLVDLVGISFGKVRMVSLTVKSPHVYAEKVCNHFISKKVTLDLIANYLKLD